MLLREFTIGDHLISLIQEGSIYVTQVEDKSGEKIFKQEFKDYESIKLCFDEIIHLVEEGNADIKAIIAILERGTV